MSIPTLQIYASIGAPAEANNYQSIDAAIFKSMLQGAEASGEKSALIRINSGGGSWIEAQSMYAYIKASALKIDTANDGIAASSASVIFMAGRKRSMAAHAKLMIHNCSSPAYGGIADLQLAIDQQGHLNDSMATLYANATGQPLEQIKQMMQATTWLSAEQALELGFATHITDQGKAALTPSLELSEAAGCLAEYTASLATYYATLLPSPTQSMKNLLMPIMAAAGLASITAEADDATFINAVSAAFTERDELKEKLSTAEAAIAAATLEKETAEQALAALELSNTQAAAAATEATALQVVATAITEGRILASQKGAFEALAKADIINATAALAAMPARKQTLTEQITADANGATGAEVRMPLTAGGVMAEIRANNAQ